MLFVWFHLGQSTHSWHLQADEALFLLFYPDFHVFPLSFYFYPKAAFWTLQ